MKKLLILMCVLALSSVASAALTLYLDGSAATSVDVLQNEVITIQLHSSDTSNYNAYVILEDLGTQVGALSNPSSEAPTGIAGELGGNSAYDEAAWGYGYLFTSASSTGQVAAGIQHTVDFESADLGTSVIGVFDGDGPYGLGGDEVSMLTINVVPEPATIALLCLGGLLLRKKK